MTRGPRVLVVAVRFPSPIQPWLLNQIVQIHRHGGSVEIVARAPEGSTYPSVVDELGLLSHTHYYSTSSPLDAVVGAGRLLLPGAAGSRAREGLGRLLRSDWRPVGARAWLKALSRASALAIDDIDLVHAHSLRYAYEYRHIPVIRRLPMVLTFHGHTTAGVGMLAEPKRRELFETVDVALVNTRFARGQLEGIGCPTEKIRILPQGIDLADYPFEPRAYPETGPVHLLSVSRLQADKGLTYAIDAVDSLLERGYDIEYTLVGGGPEEAALRTQIERLGRDDRIRLAGRVDDDTLRELYARAHLLLLPSLSNEDDDHTETQGVVIQEAQASGVIVGASRVGGIPECVEDGVSAFLFPDRDVRAIGNVISSILDRPDRWEEWQSAGRRWVESRFDINVLGTRLMELYATALAEHGKSPERHWIRGASVPPSQV